MLALGSSLAAVVPHCEHVVEYSSLTGEISVGGDAGYTACGWHIQPGCLPWLGKHTSCKFINERAQTRRDAEHENGIDASHSTRGRELLLGRGFLISR